MALNKYRLGDLIELCDEKNNDNLYTLDNVKGISTQKYFIETKANMDGVSLTSYKVVKPGAFAYVPDTSRRGDKISLAFNDTNNTYLVSSISLVFKVVKQTILIPDYLFMFFNRPEFDRYSRYNSFGSAREPFNWEDMCSIELELPDLETQEKFVNVYKSMLKNQEQYERGLDDLKLTCDAYIEDLRKGNELFELKEFIVRSNLKNNDFKIKKLIGIGVNGFIPPAQSKDETNGHICYIVKKDNFVFAPPQFHKGAIELYRLDEIVKCSDAYIVFNVISDKILKDYLLMILKSKFFQKHATYFRDGVREQFDFEQLCEYTIPVPPIDVQQSIVNIYKVYNERKQICEKLKEQIKNFCPILIKGAIEKAREV